MNEYICVCHGVVQSGGRVPFIGKGVGGRLSTTTRYMTVMKF